MALYKYVAKDKEGKTITGTAEAVDNRELVSILREKGLVIVTVSEAKAKQSLLASFTNMSFFKPKVSQDDLVIFSRILATMVSSGIPLVNALDILAEQVENPTFKVILTKVKDDVEAGASLSEGMGKFESAFSSLFVNMVRAGESSGTLDEILDRLAIYLEKINALQQKIKSAMVYPALISAMAIGVTVLLLVKVIPVFKDIYSGLGAGLPVPTQILMGLSDGMRKYSLLMVIGVVGLVIAFNRFANTPKGRLIIDRAMLKMPVFGVLIRKVAVGKFTRTLSTLVRSGVPILTCLEIVGKTAGNRVIELAVEDVRTSIKEGETISGPLMKSGVFPPMVVRMVSVGEKTGELDKMLSKISDFYDQQVDAAVSGLTSMIEPLIIAFLGIVVGGVVICMFLPIFKISTLIAA